MTDDEEKVLFAEWQQLLRVMREHNGPSAVDRLAALSDPRGLLAGAIASYDRTEEQIAAMREGARRVAGLRARSNG